MRDVDKLADDLARAAAVGGVDFIPVSGRHGPVGQDNLTLAGFFRERGVCLWTPVIRAFLEHQPAWKEHCSQKGLELDPCASAHAKMAWAAFLRRCQVEARVAP